MIGARLWHAVYMRGRTVGHVIGRRGASLLFFAMLDFIYGYSLADPPAESAQSTTTRFIATVAPLSVWATLWIAVGLVCLICAFRVRDRLAFAAAVGLKVLWGGTFLVGWMIAGLDRGWLASAIWLALALFAFIISSWPEPPEGGTR